VRGGWKRWDLAPARRGAEAVSGWEKLNAPGMAVCGAETVIVVVLVSVA
jgi:hypothetical protein